MQGPPEPWPRVARLAAHAFGQSADRSADVALARMDAGEPTPS